MEDTLILTCRMYKCDPKVNDEFWIAMTCQRSFISCDICTTVVKDVDDEEGCAYVGKGGYGIPMFLLLNFVPSSQFCSKTNHLKCKLKRIRQE